MTKNQWSRAVTVSGAMLVAVSLVLVLAGSPAGSATEQVFTARAEAKALSIKLAGTELLLGDPRVADSTADPTHSGDTSGDLLELPLLADLLAAGVANQEADFDEFGNSAACAGLVGPGGQLQISAEAPPTCLASIGPNGLVLNLTGLGLVRLRADAVYAECTANAFGGAQASAHVAGLAIDIGMQVPIFGPVFVPAVRIDAPLPQPDTQVPALQPLTGLVDLVLNDVPDTPEPGVSETTALHLSVLGVIGDDPLVEVEIGHVRCGANTVSTASIDFDTSGSLFGDAVQDQTENALAMSYTPDQDRPAVTLGARLGQNVEPDVGRGLPPQCSVSVDGTVDPPVDVILCQVGAVDAGDTVQRVIPVELEPGDETTVDAQMAVFGASLAELLGGPVEESEAIVIETTDVAGDAGGLAVPSPNRTGLPNDIGGELFLDVPDYVEEAAYGGTPCVLDPTFEPPATVYPALDDADHVTFDCGSAIAASVGSEPALAFTYAADAPPSAGTPDEGRVVVLRTSPGFGPQEVPGNSYYADLRFFVDEAAPPTTSSSTSSTSSSTSSSSSSSTSSTTPSSSSSSSSTSSSSVPASSSSTSSTIAGAGGSSTTMAPSKPLARTGAETRNTLSIALGLVGVGMVVTGRGMQAEVSLLGRRRRS